jgi:carboxypeptidase family protein/TonB-dependent receptor-like protein
MHAHGSMLLKLCFIGAALFGAPVLAGAQDRGYLHGIVLDTAGSPIPHADVAVVALRKLTKTDDEGVFRFEALPAGALDVSIRRLGFQPLRFTHAIVPGRFDTVHVSLVAYATTLEGIQVSERDLRRLLWIEDFYRRRSRGIGTFITRDDIESRRASRLSDVFRNTPGIRFVPVRGGTGIRFVSAAVQRRDCVPMIWMDGQRAPGLEVDELPVNEIEGVELYHGPSTTPIRFSQGAITTCGTIVIWTRVPGS